jgi:Rieske Fe-S protein
VASRHLVRRERFVTKQLTTTDAVPVGGGVILPDRGVVITQPTAGEFVAFSTTCPHRGCAVKAVAAGTINCFCHGSRFRIADGSVAGGPATEPLRRLLIVVAGEMIQLET